MTKTKAIIKKWYDALCFPKEYDADFLKALADLDEASVTPISGLDTKREPSAKNLLLVLYCCEELEAKYKEEGLPEEVFADTIADIVIWTKEWTAIKGELALGTLDWISHHLNMRLFKLGRLQYYPTQIKTDVKELGVATGEDVLDVHIPASGKLTAEECEASFEAAKNFFSKYRPEKEFKCFTCHSWLLDDTLKKYLPESSNILRFGDMFIKLKNDDDNALIRYMFPWDTTMENINERVPKTRAAAAVKEAIRQGEQFHVTLGARHI